MFNPFVSAIHTSHYTDGRVQSMLISRVTGRTRISIITKLAFPEWRHYLLPAKIATEPSLAIDLSYYTKLSLRKLFLFKAGLVLLTPSFLWPLPDRDVILPMSNLIVVILTMDMVIWMLYYNASLMNPGQETWSIPMYGVLYYLHYPVSGYTRDDTTVEGYLPW